MEVQVLEYRVVGVLLGLAAGDRIGRSMRMALRVAESLRDCGSFDASDIAVRYFEWWREGAFDTGPTAARVLSLAVSVVPLEGASIQERPADTRRERLPPSSRFWKSGPVQI